MRLSIPLTLPRLLLSGLLPLAVLATACGADNTDVDTGSATSVPNTATTAPGDVVPRQKLIDQEWQFTGSIVGGDAVVPVDPGTVATLRFTAEAVEGSAGCNTFTGDAVLDDDGTIVSISNVAVTEMACEDATDWPAILELGRSWDVQNDGTNLVLTASDGSGAGFNLVPVGADAAPKFDDSIGQAVADDYLGLTEDQAMAQAEADGTAARVVEREGESLAITLDINPDRLNFAISDGVVTSVGFG